MNFAGNPVIYDVNSNAAVIAAGAFAVFLLTVDAADTTVDHAFTLNFAGKSITFTLSASDDGTGTIIPPAGGGMSTADWATQIYNVFMTNYELFMNYSMVKTLNKIELTARVKGSAYTMSITDNTVTDLIGAPTTNGSDQTFEANFGILATLVDDNINIIGQDFKPVDLSGNARFDISEYLKSKLALDTSLKMTFPEDSHFSHIWTNIILPFSIAFSEKKADEIFKLVPDDVKYAIGGGLNRETLVYYNKKEIDYFSSIGYGIVAPSDYISRFLTWQPASKKTGKTVSEKLYFLVPEQTSAHTARIYVRTYFTDGSAENVSPFGDAIDLHTFQVIECSVGYDHLGFASMFSNKTVKAWEVFIVQDEVLPISEVRRFEPDMKHHSNERVFYYKNSFSTFDTIRFTGIQENNNEYEQINGAVILEEEYSETNAPLRQFQNTESQKFKISSGWLKKEWKDALRDLLLSTEIYEVLGDRLARIMNDTKKVKMFRDKEYNYSLDFEYEYANTDEFYSRVPSQAKKVSGDDITADSTQFTADSTEISADMTHY